MVLPDKFIGKPFIPLMSERLMLRPLREGDIDVMARLANNENVAGHLSQVPYPYTQEDAQWFYDKTMADNATGEAIRLAICDRFTDTFMGCIGLTEQLGFWLGEDYWGQGYGREAMTTFVRYAFEVLKKTSLCAAVMKCNNRSYRIFETLGFQVTENTELTHKITGEIMPAVIFTLTYDDYVRAYDATKRPKVWCVAGALVNEDGAWLMADRPQGKALEGLWELPGGKLEPGEMPAQALIRELKEELGIDVHEVDLEEISFVSHRHENIELLLMLYKVHKWQGAPTGREGQNLRWLTKEGLHDLQTLLPDIPLLYDLI